MRTRRTCTRTILVSVLLGGLAMVPSCGGSTPPPDDPSSGEGSLLDEPFMEEMEEELARLKEAEE